MVSAKSNPQIVLRPQDLVVLLRLSLESGVAPSYAASRNPALYELLALFDAVRGGSARERTLATTMLNERLTP